MKEERTWEEIPWWIRALDAFFALSDVKATALEYGSWDGDDAGFIREQEWAIREGLA